MMSDTLIRLAAFCAALISPVLFLLYFLSWTRTSLKSEIIWKCMAMGAISVFLAMPLSLGMETLLPMERNALVGGISKAFLVAAIPEEAAKLIVLAVIGLSGRRKSNPGYFVLFGVAVSLGFSAIENIFYVVENENWNNIAVLRGFTAVPGHAFTGALMGWAVIGAINGKNKGLWWAAAYLFPVLLHGLYDFPLMSMSLSTIDPDQSLPTNVHKLLISTFIAVVIIAGILAFLCMTSAMKSNSDRSKIDIEIDHMAQAGQLEILGWLIIGVLCLIFGVLCFSGYVWLGEYIAAIENQAGGWFIIGIAIFAILHGITFVGMAKKLKNQIV